MVIKYNKKTRDDLVAIKNFINDHPGYIDEIELFDFVISYEYYVTYYKNYHIFRDLIAYHNQHFQDQAKKLPYEYVNEDSSIDSILGL